MTLRRLLKLALADLRDEWASALCMLFAVIAILIPIMVLMSLRAGLLIELRGELGDAAKVRELRTNGEPVVTQKMLEDVRSDPLVQFVAPRAKFLASGVLLQTLDLERQEEGDMEATGPGDPLLDTPLEEGELAMSQSLAQKLDLGLGETTRVLLTRTHPESGREVEIVDFEVASIISPKRLGQVRALILVDETFLIASEQWREDPALETFAAALEFAKGPARGEHVFSGMRIYSTDISTVIALKTRLITLGLETDSQADQIRLVDRLESSLTIAIAVLAALMLFGLVLALSAIQWGWVERKKYDYSYLRLLGVGWLDVALIPMLQAALLSTLGVALSAGLIFSGQPIINGLFENQLGDFGRISVARREDVIAIGVIGLAAALLSALAASRSAVRSSPIIALRRN